MRDVDLDTGWAFLWVIGDRGVLVFIARFISKVQSLSTDLISGCAFLRDVRMIGCDRLCDILSTWTIDERQKEDFEDIISHGRSGSRLMPLWGRFNESSTSTQGNRNFRLTPCGSQMGASSILVYIS